MVGPVKAITFDLWDTLVIDDSDEPKRAAQGLLPKFEARPRVVYDALRRHHAVTLEAVVQAYRVAAAAFKTVWHDLHVTWTVRQRLSVMLAGLGLTLPREELDQVAHTLEEMEVVIPPDPVPGVREALGLLHEKYSLAVVSDTIVSPGWALRELLGRHDLAGYFDAFVFSDEIGHSKPDPRVFQAAARALSVDLRHVVHVGDREHNDVKGARAVGARAILFTAARDKDKHGTTADAVCESYADLPAIIDRLDGR